MLKVINVSCHIDETRSKRRKCALKDIYCQSFSLLLTVFVSTEDD